jgi:hypothetical protein
MKKTRQLAGKYFQAVLFSKALFIVWTPVVFKVWIFFRIRILNGHFQGYNGWFQRTG